MAHNHNHVKEEVEEKDDEEEVKEENHEGSDPTSAGCEKTALWWLLIGLLITGGFVGIFGHLLLGWSWELAMGPDLLVAAGLVLFFMQKADSTKAKGFIVGIGALVLLSYVATSLGFMFGGLGQFFSAFKPNIIYVQNTGGYDPIKYGVEEYFLSLPWQIIICLAITLMSYISIGIAGKRVHVTFHLGMLVVELLIMTAYFWNSGSIDVATDLATNNIFFMGILMSGYWFKVIDVLVLPAVGWLMSRESFSERLMADFLANPIMMIVMGLAIPVSFALMVWFINDTALTMSMGFKIITQGYIVGALISGALRELYVMTYSPKKRQYKELDGVLE